MAILSLNKYKITKNDKIIIACSGGPDSMCLLDMLFRSGYKPIVCHVNFHKRETADRDENIVKNYCISRNLVFIKEDYQPDDKGNFQDHARIFRYKFFKRVYEENNCKALLIAHQLDDCIETYLFRKERNSKSKSLTIQEIDNNFDMNVIRPLIDKSKEELQNYCVSRKLEFGIDESNFSSNYTRNKIRNEKLAFLDHKDKKKLVKQMKKDVKEWDKSRDKTLSLIHDGIISYEEFSKLSDDLQNVVLCEFIDNNCPILAHKITGGRLRQIVSELNNNQNFAEIFLENNTYLVRKLDDLFIYKIPVAYSYFVKSIDDKVAIMKEDGEKMEGINVNESDFPLIIRPYCPEDIIEIKDGHKTVDKLFQDKKIPHCMRKNWLVIENKDKKIIFVNKLYRDYQRINLQNNLFIL